MATLETRTYEQLARATAVLPTTLTGIQDPGGPMKSIEIRKLIGGLLAVAEVAEEKADLSLAHNAGVLAFVYAEPLPGKSGYYVKLGASGAGSWQWTNIVAAPVIAELQSLVDTSIEQAEAAEAARAEAELLRDQAIGGSFDFSKAIWLEVAKALDPLKYADRAKGSDLFSGASAYAAKKTLAAAYAAMANGHRLLLRNGQTHAVPVASKQYGDIASGLPRHLGNYGGDGDHAPLLDARQDLSSKVWTLLPGSTTTWKTSAVLQEAPIHAGVNVANSTKYALYFDAEDPDLPGGVALIWKVAQGSTSANEDAVKAAPGSWAINLAGSAASDIRATNVNTTNVDIVVHLADGSDPNGKPLKLSDRQTIVRFDGGEHGHLLMIGGSQKDNVSFVALNGVIPTFQSIKVLDAPCHGGVGPRHVVGEFYARGKPSPGVPIGDAKGRSLGGGLHLFTGVDLTGHDIIIGSADVGNFSTGIYGHGSGNNGYNSINFLRRSRVENSTVAVKLDGGAAPGIGFAGKGLFFHRGLDTIGGQTAFDVGDEELWYVNGGSWAADPSPNIGPGSTLVAISGSGSIYLKDYDFSIPVVGTAPNFFIRVLFNWSPYYGHTLALANGWIPTITLDNVQDNTPINTGVAQRKAGFYASEASAPNKARVHMVLRNGTTLGDMWNGFTWNTYPESLITEAGTTIGFGLKTRADVRAAMDALGRDHDISEGTTLVDGSGNVVDPPA